MDDYVKEANNRIAKEYFKLWEKNTLLDPKLRVDYIRRKHAKKEKERRANQKTYKKNWK